MHEEVETPAEPEPGTEPVVEPTPEPGEGNDDEGEGGQEDVGTPEE